MESRSESGIDVLKETCYSVARASEVACILYAKVAQSVEHSTENAGVGGSIPPLGTFCCLSIERQASNSLGSHSKRTQFFPALLTTETLLLVPCGEIRSKKSHPTYTTDNVLAPS